MSPAAPIPPIEHDEPRLAVAENAATSADVVSEDNVPGMPLRVRSYVYVVVALAGALAWLTGTTEGGVHSAVWWSLAPFVGLVALAETMDVRFRLHGQIEAFNLQEAVLTPLVFAFAAPKVMLAVVIGQSIAGIVRRNDAIKVLFNAAQWALAAGIGSVVFTALSDGNSITTANISALVAAMIVVGIVNQVAITIVISLAQRRTLRQVLGGLSPVIVPGWLIAWSLNTLVGLLFVFAFQSSRFAALLFFVPLALLHAAYKGYVGTESDRMRLAGLHRASQVLAEPDDPDHAVADFLAEVSSAFEADTAELLLIDNGALVIHSVHKVASSYSKENDEAGADGLRNRLIESTSAVRITEDNPEFTSALAEVGWRDCLVAPLPSDDTVVGALVVYNQGGLEGFKEGELAVLQALARETASSFARGRLFATIVHERDKLSQLVDATSDGILTVDDSGIVRAWNPGWEQITGYTAQIALNRSLNETISLLDADGRTIPVAQWAVRAVTIPATMQVRDRSGAVHWLECSYRTETSSETGARILTIVAQDTSDTREVEQLREDVDRLAELESLQRQRVLQLQESLQPPAPDSNAAEFGVHYLPSDDNAPTGGDYYDWQELPDGDVHIAIVDVLGHGVEATNDAFAVIHTLRTLALQGERVEKLVGAADELLSLLNPELVATVITARYNPRTGSVCLAGGGHPPALLVRGDGRVDEIAAPGIPVGWPGAGSMEVVEVHLAPSETIVFYTDGLIEAHRDIIEGLAALANTARATANLPAAEMARVLVERSLEGADRRDDSLALVIRHVGAAVPAAGYDFSYRGTPEELEVANVRHAFCSWVTERGGDKELTNDMAIVVSELATNSVRVATQFFEVRARVSREGLVVEVEDDGPAFEPSSVLDAEHSVDDESGRGLLIVQSLVDDMNVVTLDGGCVIQLLTRFEQGRFGPTSEARSSASSRR